MGEYHDFRSVKHNKRSLKRFDLRNVRSILEQWDNRKKSGMYVKYFKGYITDGNHTSAEICFDTYHNTYQIFFTNVFEGISFLLKHNMCSIEQLLQGTEPNLRKIVMDAIEKYEISRIKRKIRYSRQRGNN